MINLTETTKDAIYADYLIQNQKSTRAKVLQFPYRAHLKCLSLGKTLDIGCGAGRNLRALNQESVGIDHNEWLVKACNQNGLKAYLTDDFVKKSEVYSGKFDSILLSHVAEHMRLNELIELLKSYQGFLKPNGKLVVICPQEKGYASDSTHVEFMDFEKLNSALSSAGFVRLKQYSFPFPRLVGKFFPQNEFVLVSRRSEC